jgi:hypothetical protein
MTPLNVNLQLLIEALDDDLVDGDPLSKVAEAQQRARSLADIGDQLVDHFVTAARGTGAPWSQIGDALGVSKQAAQQRWMPPLFQLFTNRARHVVVLAQERARDLRHDFIGSEHILLGILDESEGAAAQVLASMAGSIDAVRQAMLAAAPAGTATPPAKIPFTQDGKDALGQANAAAVAMGHNYVGTEHLLLGLLAAGDESTAGRVLLGLGVDRDGAKAAVEAWTAEYLTANPAARKRVADALARAEAAGIQLDVDGTD